MNIRQLNEDLEKFTEQMWKEDGKYWVHHSMQNSLYFCSNPYWKKPWASLSIKSDFSVHIYGNNKKEGVFEKDFKFNSYEDLKQNWDMIVKEFRTHEGVKKFDNPCPSQEYIHWMLKEGGKDPAEIKLTKELKEEGLNANNIDPGEITVRLSRFTDEFQMHGVGSSKVSLYIYPSGRINSISDLIDDLQEALDNAKKLKEILVSKNIIGE